MASSFPLILKYEHPSPLYMNPGLHRYSVSTINDAFDKYMDS